MLALQTDLFTGSTSCSSNNGATQITSSFTIAPPTTQSVARKLQSLQDGQSRLGLPADAAPELTIADFYAQIKDGVYVAPEIVTNGGQGGDVRKLIAATPTGLSTLYTSFQYKFQLGVTTVTCTVSLKRFATCGETFGVACGVRGL